MSKKCLRTLAAALLFTAAAAAPAMAQTAGDAAAGYPNRLIRMVVPVGAGGITDIIARSVADALSKSMGQPFIIDNKVGASGIIGTELVTKAAPDGYTLLMVYPTHPVNLSLYKKLPYDTVADLAPISRVGSVQQLLVVSPSLPAKTVKELVDYAKANPGKLNFGSTGIGSLAYLTAELFAATTGIKLTHVPFGGQPQMEANILSGEVPVGFLPPITTVPQIQAGKMRVLGVANRARLPQLPDAPTFIESGLPELADFEVQGWNGILAPAGTPRPIINKLNAEIVKALSTPELAERLRGQGVEPIPNTPDEFDALIRSDIARWGKIIKDAGIQPQ